MSAIYFWILDRLIRRPATVLCGITLLAGVGLALCLPRLRIDADVSHVLPTHHPHLQAFQKFLQLFAENEPTFVVVDDPNRDLDLDQVEASLLELDGVKDVYSGPDLEALKPVLEQICTYPYLFLQGTAVDGYTASLEPDPFADRLMEMREKLETSFAPQEIELFRMDPTGVLTHLPRALGSNDGVLNVVDGAFRTSDDKKQVFLLIPESPPFDSDFSRRYVDTLQQALPDLLHPRDYYFFGGHLYAASDAAGIRKGLSSTLSISLILLCVLFALAYGRIHAFLAPLPAILSGLGLVLWLMVGFGHGINVITAAFSGVVLGLGVDAAVHMMSVLDWREPELAKSHMKRLLKPLVGAMLTTVAAFFSLTLMDLPVLRHLGWLCGLGVLFTQSLSLFLVPLAQKCFVIHPRIQSHVGFLDALVNWGATRRGIWPFLPLIAIAALLFFIPNLHFEPDLRKLRSKNPLLLNAEQAFVEDFQHLPETTYYVLEAQQYPDFYRALREDMAEIQKHGIGLPLDPRIALPKAETYQLPHPLPMDRLPPSLNPDAFDWPRSSGSFSQVLGNKDYVNSVRFFFRTTDQGYLLGIKTSVPKGAPLPELTHGVMTNLTRINQIVSQRIQHAFSQSVMVLLPCVLLVLALVLRSLWPVLASFSALLLSVGLTLAFLVVTHRPISLANLVVVPLLLGIGIDDAIHMSIWFGAPDCLQRWRQSARGILMTTLTTMVGFGALALAPYPGLREMGVLVNLGLISCLLSTLVVIPLLLPLGMQRHDGESS